jgi:putative ABC transport system ATP-binding protein
VQAGLILFSAVGLLKSKKTAYYSTLIVSITSIVLSASSIIIYYENDLINVNLTATFLSSMLIGLLLAIDIFASETPENKRSAMATESNDSYAIQTINASKNYLLGSNAVPAVKNIDMTIKKGEFVAIMGPSGSGKSTLLNLLGALDKPSSGRILIDGVDISDLNQDELAKLRNEKLGFVFQAYNLIARSSVNRNLELPALVKGYSKEERSEKISYLLDMVHLSSKAPVKPRTLSGGEQQRIAICRALINDPEIILADEPTGNLDSKSGQEIMGFLRNLNAEKKTTIVVVTHDLEVAKKTDRIIYFRDGRIMKEEETSVGILS